MNSPGHPGLFFLFDGFSFPFGEREGYAPAI